MSDPPLPANAVHPSEDTGPRRGRLVALAVFWSVGAFIAGTAASYFASYLIRTRLGSSLGQADRIVLVQSAGTVGAASVFLWAMLHEGATQTLAGIWARLDDGPIAHKKTIILIAALMAIYATVVPMALVWMWPRGPANPQSASGWTTMAMIGAIVIFAPLAEELFFRGWLWGALRRDWGPVATAIATSGVWLIVHLPILHMLTLIPLAVALSLARHFGQSIRAPLLVHVCNNLFAVASPWLGASVRPM